MTGRAGTIGLPCGDGMKSDPCSVLTSKGVAVIYIGDIAREVVGPIRCLYRRPDIWPPEQYCGEGDYGRNSDDAVELQIVSLEMTAIPDDLTPYPAC